MTTPKRKPGNAETTPKTVSQRQASLRARRTLQGLSEVRNIYLPPALHGTIKREAQSMFKCYLSPDNQTTTIEQTATPAENVTT